MGYTEHMGCTTKSKRKEASTLKVNSGQLDAQAVKAASTCTRNKSGDFAGVNVNAHACEAVHAYGSPLLPRHQAPGHSCLAYVLSCLA